MAKVKLLGEGGILERINRKSVIIVGAVLLIGAAIWVNYLWFGDNTVDTGNPQGGDTNTSLDGGSTDGGGDAVDAYFSSTVLSRQQARDEALDVLQQVVDSETALESAKTEALAEISRIALDIESETNIETLVKAKGFAQCVAVIGGDTASIVVSNGDAELLPNQVAQINEIVYQQTGILPANVRIIQK